MTTFKGGPADGQTLTLKRRPILLRVVQDNDGQFDALDMPDDEPRADEKVFVYILAKTGASGFLDGRDKQGKRWGTSFAGGEYRICPFQPGEEEGLDRNRFVEWCESNRAVAENLRAELRAENGE